MAALPSIRPPVTVIMGSPGQTARLIVPLDTSEITCFQMDLHQAERVRAKLVETGRAIEVRTGADLWDLPADFQTVLYPTAAGTERSLKLDMVEQAFHVLRPQGMLIVFSPFSVDDFFPKLLKKIFGKVHSSPTGKGQTFWCRRERERPRRRHEVTVQVRLPDGQSQRFLSRPGVFTYGSFDLGARALVETMRIEPGDHILDMGCGYGSIGFPAASRSGAAGQVTFVDSNLRALLLAEHNARANGIARFQLIRSDHIDELRPGTFDVALANPPYYAQLAIGRYFVDRCALLLRPGGRFYLVTKQARELAPIIGARFASIDIVARRGYSVLHAQAPAPQSRARP